MLKVLYLVTLMDSLGMALSIPLINSNVLALGGSLLLAGVLQSLTFGAQLFAGLVIESRSDTRGRKLFLLSTLIVVFISNALSGMSSMSFFFFGRILYGIAHQTDPLIETLIVDSVPEEQLTGTFNKLIAIIVSVFIVGPVLGTFFYELFEEDFSYISLILCTLDVVTISVVYFFVEENIKPKDVDSNHKQDTHKITFIQTIYKDLGKVLSNLKNAQWSVYGDLLVIKFIHEAAFNMLFLNMGVILMRKFWFTQTQMGLSLSYLSLSMTTSKFLARFIIKTLYEADRNGIQRISHGFILLCTLFSLLPFTLFANTAVLYLVIFLPLCIVKSMLNSTWIDALPSRTTETEKTVMMGAATNMLSLAGLVCPLVNGFTVDFIGLQALTMLPIASVLVGTVLVNKVKHRIRIPAEKQD